MEKKLYSEMSANVEKLNDEIQLNANNLFVFGYCKASMELIDLLAEKNIEIKGILDNSEDKQLRNYKGAKVYYPDDILKLVPKSDEKNSVVLVVSRFYETMAKQLRGLGYKGRIEKIVNYNTYSDYSLSDETLNRMIGREQSGERLIKELESKYQNAFKVFFPFNALGDVYIAMSYWYAFAKLKGIVNPVFCVPSKALKEVVLLFGNFQVEVYNQENLDSMVQAAICMRDDRFFIAHHDRPYVVYLHKALYFKMIPLDMIYRCGVYGLSVDAKPMIPRINNKVYKEIEKIPKGKAVIFSPYAKSITTLSENVWNDAVNYYKSIGYKCYTNVVGDEQPLKNTEAISPSISEIRAVVEQAGLFVGIRSGLCDVIREAKAKKIALYPDYNYCDTKWKAIDIYYIDQFDYNILANENIKWEIL
ncbi:MAG: hypothetical protein MJ123_01080 [Lachnospiraceae bacterium]|nr:hypothetical protein [Lachnospiraceae bacterium]